jgi:hypothetical protein
MDTLYSIDLNFNLPEDPTEIVTKNKEFLSELKKFGFDGREVRKMLEDYNVLGLGVFKMEEEKPAKGWISFDDLTGTLKNEPLASPEKLKKYRSEYESFCKGVDDAKRTSKLLLNNKFISTGLRKLLNETVEHLTKVKEWHSYKPFQERPLQLDETEKRANSITQITSLQVVEIYNYIKSFEMEMVIYGNIKSVTEGDIFSLICEIFNGIDHLKPYTKEYIKRLYYENK